MAKWRNIRQSLIPLTLIECLALELSVAVSITINLIVLFQHIRIECVCVWDSEFTLSTK